MANIEEIVKKNVRRFILEELKKQSKNEINEAKQDVKPRDFNAKMKELGFEFYNSGRGSGFIYYIPSEDESYSKKSKVTVHTHGKYIKASSLIHVKDTLKSLGWFEKKENFDKFPFDEWEISRKDINGHNTETNSGKQTNKEYENAEITPVFQMKDSICVIKTEKGYNLCRNSNDKEPMYQTWFDSYGVDRKTGKTICLKRDNYETCETEAYPITQDGLDTQHVIIENKSYKKKKFS